MPYEFLTDEWIDEARSIRAEYAGKATPIPHVVRMNLVVNELPFGDGTLQAHMDTSSGEIELDKGHLDSPDLTVEVGYDIARMILVDGNPQAGMNAFMQGKVKIEGDMMKLMLLQSVPPDDTATELATRIREITV